MSEKKRPIVLDDSDVSFKVLRYRGPGKESPRAEQLRKQLERDGIEIDPQTGERRSSNTSTRRK